MTPTRARLRAERSPAGTAQLSIARTSPLRFGRASDYTITSLDDDALLTERMFPFRTVRMRPNAAPTILLSPALGFSPALRMQVLSGWRSQAVVVLDRGFLQALVDPRSDTRVLVRFNEDGTVARIAPVEVALGLIDTRASERLLLAMRDIGHKELVVYRWRWRATH